MDRYPRLASHYIASIEVAALSMSMSVVGIEYALRIMIPPTTSPLCLRLNLTITVNIKPSNSTRTYVSSKNVIALNVRMKLTCRFLKVRLASRR